MSSSRPALRILSCTVDAVTGAVTWDNGVATDVGNGIINVGFPIQRASICVQDQGGSATTWSFKVVGLPSSDVKGTYGDYATVGEAIATHTDVSTAGVIVSGTATKVNTVIYPSFTITDRGTATTFDVEIVVYGY